MTWRDITDREILAWRDITDIDVLAWAQQEMERLEKERKARRTFRGVFNLDRIKALTEAHIDEAEWIEGPCGEKRRTLVIEILADSHHGAYIPGIILELFGEADGYDLEDPYNYDKNETIYDALMFLENEIADCLNELIPSKGYYYIGFHEDEGSYCLFYEEVKE